MADPVEMDTNLMCTAGLQTTFHHSHISESLQHLVMCHGMLAVITLRKDLETHPVVGVTPDVACDCPLIILEIAPYDGHIAAFYRMDEELLCKVELRLIIRVV